MSLPFQMLTIMTQFDNEVTNARTNSLIQSPRLMSPTTINIFDGTSIHEQRIPLDRVAICMCKRCIGRKKRGLRPLPIFSPNHKTYPKGMRVLVFDTETTGLPKRRNASVTDSDAWGYIVQWSWFVYDVDEKRIVTVSDHIVKLPNTMTIPEESTKIHGITTEKMRREGEHFKKVLTEFTADYEMCNYLVAHNLEFDRKMVQVECCRHHLPVNYVWSRRKVVEYCTMKQSKSLCGMKGYYKKGPNAGKMYIRFPKLLEVHQVLFDKENKTTLNNLHNSLVDIVVCFRCFHVLVFEKDPFEYSSVIHALETELISIYGNSYVRILKKLVS